MSTADDYILKNTLLSRIKPDPTVVLKKSLWKYLPGLIGPQDEQHPDLQLEEWYPLANSYYPFTEDVDAIARVYHLLESKQSTDSLLEKDDVPVRLANEYSERNATRQHLRTNPFCFLLLGKPGLGEEDLGRRLAAYWGCVYVDPLTLVQEEIEKETRAGQCVEFNLRCGRAMGIDVITRLLAKKAQTPQVLNRGMVLCGFPLIPNDLFEEDPVSSESAVFNVKDIFEEIFEQVAHTVDISDKMVVSMAESSRENTTRDSLQTEVVALEVADNLKMAFDWSTDTNIVGPSDISTDLEKQMNCVFGLFHNPFMIIYLHARNSDVVTKRDNYYYDVYSDRNLDMQKVRLFYEIGAANELLTEDLFDAGRNPFGDNPDLRHLVKLPENLPGMVRTQLDRYHNEIANILDNHVLSHPVQYFLKLDGRAFISQMMKLVEMRLKVLPLSYVLIPTRFGRDLYENVVGEGAPPEKEILSNEEAFQLYSKQNIVGPMFKWLWSDWGQLCPSSMVRGLYQKGSSKYAVRFFNKILFLADEKCYNKFCENPRRYLHPSYPKPGRKLFIFGPPISGKSSVAKCLGYFLNSKVITPDQLLGDYYKQVIEEHKERMKQAAISEALEILTQKKIADHDEKKARRRRQIEEWEARAIVLLEKLDEIFAASDKKSIQMMSPFPMMMEREKMDMRSLDEELAVREQLAALNFPKIYYQEECRKLLEDRAFLLSHLPVDLQLETAPEEASVLDPFVLHYANSKVTEIVPDEIDRKVEDTKYEMYIRGIRAIEEGLDYEGWIVDGMTTDIEILKQAFEDFPPDDVLILTTSDYDYLVERFRRHKKHLMKFHDFRNFFLAIGEKDAAWRSPSATSTDSYRNEIVADVISDILDFSEEVSEADRAIAAERYERDLKIYQEQIANVSSLFEEIDVVPLNVAVKNSKIQDLLKEAMNILQDKYRRRPSEFTDEDRAEELQAIMAQTVPSIEGEGGCKLSDEFYAKNRRFGDTNIYCPVSFSKRFVLRRGKEKYAVKFKDKVYLLATESHMQEFMKFPRKYLLQTAPPQRFPPPRVCLIGVNEAQRNEVGKKLSTNLGVRYFDFLQLRRAAVENLSNISLMVQMADELPDVLRYDWYDTLFRRIFFEEPLQYSGFVLDGFPITASDFNYMISHEAVPDAVICLLSSREDYVNTELKKYLDEWRVRNEESRVEEEVIRKIIRDQWEEMRKWRYNELMEAKRTSRYANKIQQIEEDVEGRGYTSDTQISLDSVVEQQDHDETMRILDEELQEPVLDEGPGDNEDEVVEKVTADLEGKYDAFAEAYDGIRKICDDELVPCLEINANHTEKATRHAYIIGNELKFRGPSFFERCYEVPPDLAEKLLRTGYFLFSNFGRMSPVQYYGGHNPLHLYLVNEAKSNIYPVIHRHYIYFLAGKNERDQFMKNPLKYVQLDNFNFPLIPMRVAVIGPPKSGKTSLANRFNRDLGFHVVSRGEAARYTLSHPLCTNLKATLDGILRKGDELSDEIVMDCVQVASFCGECVTRGLVFDGFPNSITETKLLSRLGLVPHLIIDLEADDETVFKQAATPTDKHPLFSLRFIQHLLRQWKTTKDEFRKWCDLEYQNLYKLPVDRCIWGVWDQAKELTLSVAFERRHYYKYAQWDWPLRLAYMLVTPLEFLERQSGYKSYCPGCLYYSRALTNGGEPPDRTGLVQYRKHYYWLCEKHIEEFLKDPDKFLVPSNESLPPELPELVVSSEEARGAVEDGYCVVCYQQNIPNKVLNKGQAQYSVLYKHKTYLFDSAECLSAFMATPQQFCNMTINFKQDEFAGVSLAYCDLPVLGMLEQYVARILVKAVNHVNVHRPVIPGLTITQAAIIGVGLNLKIFNPGTPKEYVPRYERALEKYHERRLNLMNCLELMKKYLNPYVHYEEPDTPPSWEEETDDEEQASLKGIEP